MLTINEVAARLGVSRRTAVRYQAVRNMPTATGQRGPHGPKLYEWAQIEEWANQTGIYDGIVGAPITGRSPLRGTPYLTTEQVADEYQRSRRWLAALREKHPDMPWASATMGQTFAWSHNDVQLLDEWFNERKTSHADIH
jgi:hypothetical protein